MPKITAIVVAAGSGTRMKKQDNKVFLPLGKSSVIDYTIKAISGCDEISDIVLVVRKCDIERINDYINVNTKNIKVIEGGKTRQESVYLGLVAAKGADYVVIHDGARALVTPEIIKQTIKDVIEYKAAAAGVCCKDTLKMADDDGFIASTLDREKTFLIQTPQNFEYSKILKAHEEAIKDEFVATDDCMLYEKYIGRVKISKGSYENIKLTTFEDMIVAEKILKELEKE